MLAQKTIDIIKSTVPVLEVHGTAITTAFYKNLFEAHPELLNIFNGTNQKQGRQQTALANTVLAAAKYIDKLETIIPVVTQISQKHRSLAIKPEHYPIVGEHLLGAIKEVLGEAATDEIIGAWGEAYGVIAQVFIDIEDNMYKEAAKQPGGWKEYKEFKIIEKVKESDVITSFYLQPADGSQLPVFKPGQYITIRISIPGEQYLFNRQYSLSAAPGLPYFRISVKKESEPNTPEGMVSNEMHKNRNIGDTIEITAPAGDFTLNDHQTPVVLLSGGVGITPFMSMINSIAKNAPDRKTAFVHASRNGKLQAFTEELQSLSETMDHVSLSYVYENPSEEDKQNRFFSKQGYIDAAWLEENAFLKDADYYICGPVPFLRAMISNLKQIGVPGEKIHFEFFGPAMNLETEA
ncbi:NO-inducible flavohemoprotein [Bacillus sp. MUM 13]|uniref:NO-inducible flavohemoprotein n=1 Tax=Bacillus sp. MUM 13 TaxID=1678001 RepID=UPI0008F5A80F|nr:NO-inducible flavohemoprotein [Bacillus sp. MUM 13]OIK07435.1 nitric oxide dioxygenase [Bacillus sp. MUM 13]